MIFEWSKLDPDIRHSPLYPIFITQILEFIRSSPNIAFNVCNSVSLNYLSILTVGLSRLHEYKFRHKLGFTEPYLWFCQRYQNY